MGTSEKRGVTAGSYSIGDSELFARIGEERNHQPAQRIMPEMRIGRPVNIDDQTKIAWHKHLDVLGKNNYGRGKAIAFGSMMLTHTNAKEMGTMVSRKQPDLFTSRNARRLLSYYRNLAGEYNHFVRGNDADAIEVHTAIATGEEGKNLLDQGYRSWGVGMFETSPQPYNAGKNDLSILFSIEDEEMLKEEMRESWKYLKQSGYDTRIIDSARRPHLVKFETFHPIGQVAVKADRHPQDVSLMAPHALVCDNSPDIPR